MMEGFVIKSAAYDGYYVANPERTINGYTKDPRKVKLFAGRGQAEAEARPSETVVAVDTLIEEMFR